jgi:hypothetical protein
MQMAVWYVVVSEVLADSIISVLIAVMMQAGSTSEMLVNFYQPTQCYNPGNSHLQYFFPLHN